MTDPVLPRRLRAGDLVRVVAPSLSYDAIDGDIHRELTDQRFGDLGLRVTFGDHVRETDAAGSSSVATRVADLHAAFADNEVAAVLSVIGGYNANEMLPHLDFDLIAANPKIFCGYSDITALQGAMLARANLVTYCGPHWSTFGMRDHLEQTLAWFAQTVLGDGPVTMRPASGFTDDAWFAKQDDRTVYPTDGWWALRSGRAAGRAIVGNLCTLNLLQGTPFMPDLREAVLIVEDDEESRIDDFRRNLASLLQVPGAETIRALVIGRFQRASRVTRAELDALLDVHPQLRRIPVLANVDLGHTQPMMTLPMGGFVEVHADEAGPHLTLPRPTDRQVE